MAESFRTGRDVRQLEGYEAFIPAPLPPDPPIEYDAELQQLLSTANRALGRLDGAMSILPSPNFFVNMYSRLEAVLSSQIEGTQSSLQDVLEYEVNPDQPGLREDVKETFNYFKAMDYGLTRLTDLPLSLRLIREIHAKLLQDVRGNIMTPGEFRTSQNWIGPPGTPLAQAIYVPPPVHEMNEALANLERFLHRNDSMEALVHCGIAHAQFETIHPFLDGNGRVGRLLITFLLCWQEVLSRPLLYLSHYFKANRDEYYNRLMAVRFAGDWEGWLKFFLTGVAQVSKEATDTARGILDMREKHREIISREMPRSAGGGFALLERLLEHPITKTKWVCELLNCSYPTAAKMISRFSEMGLLREMTGRQRNRLYFYDPLIRLLPSSNPAG